ncbi:hypothetical protein BE20_01175 [Sorangium cellulosum]|nr:hypothetical protein BE20_01175 [Sorangium cellulosum]
MTAPSRVRGSAPIASVGAWGARSSRAEAASSCLAMPKSSTLLWAHARARTTGTITSTAALVDSGVAAAPLAAPAGRRCVIHARRLWPSMYSSTM